MPFDDRPAGRSSLGAEDPPGGWTLLVASLRLYARAPRIAVVSALQGGVVVGLFALVWHPVGGVHLRRLLEGQATTADVALLAGWTGLVVAVGLVAVTLANGVVVGCVAATLRGERPGLLAAARTVRSRWRAIVGVALPGSALGTLLRFTVAFVYVVLVRPLLLVKQVGAAKRLVDGLARAKPAAVVALLSRLLGPLSAQFRPERGGLSALRWRNATLAVPAIVVDGDDAGTALRRSHRLLAGTRRAPDRSLKFALVPGWVLLAVPGAYLLTPVLTWVGYAPTNDFAAGLMHGLYTSVFATLASGLVALTRLGFYRYARTGDAPAPAYEFPPIGPDRSDGPEAGGSPGHHSDPGAADDGQPDASTSLDDFA